MDNQNSNNLSLENTYSHLPEIHQKDYGIHESEMTPEIRKQLGEISMTKRLIRRNNLHMSTLRNASPRPMRGGSDLHHLPQIRSILRLHPPGPSERLHSPLVKNKERQNLSLLRVQIYESYRSKSIKA